jgi:hypothetical protein
MKLRSIFLCLSLLTLFALRVDSSPPTKPDMAPTIAIVSTDLYHPMAELIATSAASEIRTIIVVDDTSESIWHGKIQFSIPIEDDLSVDRIRRQTERFNFYNPLYLNSNLRQTSEDGKINRPQRSPGFDIAVRTRSNC